ncbi:indolepyruvate ferredoxin oxidoreductase family protein [Alphaproteobacteria bacterium LMG 31809]|uniref:Indolepyruvate ferredoxin oxidoreductase family protein n=2 Tax=Govanella unica TaxID=2975056 RepID=A0A9X3Z5U3_9PROT|nr:indolepyruvate ferredoxin oxidoreductase family protein [Govania unica]MDA5192466.1 indolepyruvate ferredoxin oxidoreductase family protein [Govania unica]
MKFDKVTLDDKYTQSDGSVFMSGTQALVRLPIIQQRRDAAAGLNTAGFISGYRGSPLGGYDQALVKAKKILQEHHIEFQPGVNEDLAATAVWGSQQVNLFPGARYDGVFGLWYGKGPGVDRSGDVFRHANAAGTAPLGGVLAIAGDDHGCKSSTLPHQTDHTFYGIMMPILYPSSVQEFVEYGLLGIAMSRYSGCWVAFKTLAETVEVSASVSLAGEKRQILLPGDDEFEMPPGGVNIRIEENWKNYDYLLQRYKLFAAIAFAKKNNINRTIWDSPRPRFGIITSGKSYEDVREALTELGITEAIAAEIGLRLYKVGMPWPLEPDGVRHFSEGLEEVLVVEEKRELIENQIKQQLFNWRADVRPLVVGKVDERGDWLLHPENDLSVGEIAHVIASRLSRFYDSERMRERLAYYTVRETEQAAYQPDITRKAYFCSGCPHNTSTRVPDGSRAMAGIGCHIMATWMDRSTATYTHMGGEGVPWVGSAPFTDEKHIFANLGDGTYYHSGSLAIRQSVAAGINITYKILFNDAVAMTGGQPFDGPLSVPMIANQVLSEGAKKVVIVTDEPDKYPADAGFPEGITIRHRDELDNVQKQMREETGTTVIIYDQTCAAEKRRRRKRGTFPDPQKRVIINDLVCEGCGDCSVQSNCVSVEPLETEFGRKRQINQSTCNKDFSCVKGFCPSFVTVYGGKLRKTKAGGFDDLLKNLPDPVLPEVTSSYDILVTGIGGTGVVTIGALLGMAAHLEHKPVTVLDMAGLAQKGGAVYSHVRVGPAGSVLYTPKIITGGADLLLACDAVVAAAPAGVELLRKEQTAAVINSHRTPVAGFVLDKNIDFKDAAVREALRKRTRPEATHFVNATETATALMGDSIATNLFMLGYAYQKGLIPLSADAIEEAIALNGTAVDSSLKTFRSGRLAAHDESAVATILKPLFEATAPAPLSQSLEEMIERRVSFLTAYQNAAYGTRYRDLVAGVRARETMVAPGQTTLTEAVARYAFKLMAYKDEYEVARLYTEGTFEKHLKAQFEGDYKIEFNLAPPLLSKTDAKTGRPGKMTFGPWMLKAFRLLASLKGLRGTAFDIFGYSHDRRVERQLITAYEAAVQVLTDGLSAANHGLAVEIARLPEDIRGYGPVKDASLKTVQGKWDSLMARFRNPSEKARSAA